MDDRVTILRLADLAWQALLDSIDGLTQEESWSPITLRPGAYLHTEGSILSQLAHVASGKVIYASVGFRDTEVRWRELASKVDAIWPSLSLMTEWLHESHEYWSRSWADVDDLAAERPRFDGTLVPGWKLIATGIHHDHYHAGQIQLQRAICGATSTPPPAEGALWEQYCGGFTCW